MTDIRQSSEYATYLKSLGWQVEKLGKWNVFIKKFPLLGSLFKIQRTPWPLPFYEIENLARKYQAFQIIIEPASSRQLSAVSYQSFRPLKSPFIPTKTLVKNLKPSEQEIFTSFSKSKRRDIRLAEKKGLTIEEGNAEDFVNLKKHSLLRKLILPLGTGKEIYLLCQAFGKKSKILLAKNKGKIIAGTLLLFHNRVAYYWQAAATSQGKKLLAPTLLIWEAIKLAKRMGCLSFDFEGIFDERFPQQRDWLGFTNFKKGFRGREIIYPAPLVKNNLNFLFLKNKLLSFNKTNPKLHKVI